MSRFLCRVVACALWLTLGAAFSVSLTAEDGAPSFNRDIRPILADKCFACHGFDAKKREADLRLDTPEGAFAKRDGNPAVTPGDLTKSQLWQRVTSDDPDVMMPPPAAKKELTAGEKALLERWIEAGAPYQKHWAFEPIARPSAPGGATGPAAIDAFLEQRIQQAGLTSERRASTETLMRRVSFALTGLPPTLEDLEKYGGGDSERQYEDYVDHLLQSPRYGEEMGRHWLDVARYADTHGLHLDNERQMWAYRDWVVKAFNDNLPYDKFTIWQVAGDLLPEPTTDQLVATGFNRCNVTTSEGGSIEAEFVYRYAVERASTVAQAWLGLTAGCAVCHDHKYDPISAKEFYSLYAFFHSNADPAMDGNTNVTAPFLKLPNEHQQSMAAAAGKVEREARAWLDTIAASADYRDPVEVNAESDGTVPGGSRIPLAKDVREVLFDDAIPLGSISRSNSRNPVSMIVDPRFKAASGRRVIHQAFGSSRTDTIEFKLRPIVVPENGQIEASVRVEPLDIPRSVAIGVAAGGKRPMAGKSAEWTRQGAGLVRSSSKDQPIRPGEWTRLVVPAADLGLKPGDELNGVSLQQNGGVCDWDLVTITGEADPATDPLQSLTAWRKAVGTTPPPELPTDLVEIVKLGPAKELTEEQAAKLRRFYVALIARPMTAELEQARVAWEAARTSRIIAEESAPGTFVFRDLPKPRESFVMVRGQYDKPGDQVEPGVPAVLPPIKKEEGERLTRLDLANWLVAPENPLMARVAVNRLWQQMFGTGLVKTSYDFGTQGEPPSHPELLDWLAADFRDSGWEVKRFVKQLLMSESFCRESAVSPELLAKDPGNRLYARGPRFRLDAEQVRDNALFVSGLMNFEMGGPGVKTYQPANIWEPVGYSDSNTRFYLQDHGPALYRRSLYVFLKRTAPPPFMSNFDGPNREQVCMLRERSNTPLQALQLMNDTQHFEAARALAERALCEGGENDENRVTWLYRTVLSRTPASDELSLVVVALAKQRELFANDEKAAKESTSVGESKPKNIAPPAETAAWTMIANLILNLDESVCRN
jgi:hypothetical protein